MSKLSQITKECARVNWDYYGALPVDEVNASMARIFLQVIPDDIPLPDFEVDPDGEVVFDWYDETSGIFSVSISEDGTLSFDRFSGKEKTRGQVQLDTNGMPGIILDFLQRMYLLT